VELERPPDAAVEELESRFLFNSSCTAFFMLSLISPKFALIEAKPSSPAPCLPVLELLVFYIWKPMVSEEFPFL
jgi:hypothetical protein